MEGRASSKAGGQARAWVGDRVAKVGCPNSGFFGVALAHRPDMCNARQVILRNPRFLGIIG